MHRTRLAFAVVAAGALIAGSAATHAAAGTALKGTLEVMHGDSFQASSGHSHSDGADEALPGLEHWLNDGGHRTRLEFPGNPPQLPTGTEVSVAGEPHNDHLVVSSLRVEAAPGGGKGGSGSTPAPLSGPRDLLVIMFNFAGDPTNQPLTVDGMRASAFTGSNSINNYYKETSFENISFKGKLDESSGDPDSAPGDVAGWYTIDASTTTCDHQGWATAARDAAAAAGWDLSGYEHIMHVFPFTSVCQWRGLGHLGGAYTWINGTEGIPFWPDMHFEGILAHEIGHNLTLYHSRTLDCSSGGVRISFARRCNYSEYGDPFDVMGQAYRQLHVRNKGHLGWFPSAKIATGTSDQTYTLYPIENSFGGLQVLRIPRGKDFLYVEARAPFGFDSLLPPDAVTGVLLRTGPDLSNNGNSYLIDTAPYTATYADAALQLGEAFVDTVKNIYVETVGVDDDGSVTVLVKTGYSNTVPTVDAGAAHGLVLGSEHRHDSATASDSSKNLSSYEWSWSSCPSTCPALTDAAGGLSGGSSAISGPAFTPTVAGTYRLSLTVWDGAGAKATVSMDEVAG
jgi:hypothetical protein